MAPIKKIQEAAQSDIEKILSPSGIVNTFLNPPANPTPSINRIDDIAHQTMSKAIGGDANFIFRPLPALPGKAPNHQMSDQMNKKIPPESKDCQNHLAWSKWLPYLSII